MTTRKARAMQVLGSNLGAMVHLDTFTDEELDAFTRVGTSATAEDRAHIRKTIRFLERLADSMQRTLAKVESS